MSRTIAPRSAALLIDELVDALEELQLQRGQELGAAMLAEAMEASPFSSAVRNELEECQARVNKLEQDGATMEAKVTQLEECLASTLPHPSIVGDTDPEFQAELQRLKQQRAINGKKWHTDSERKVRTDREARIFKKELPGKMAKVSQAIREAHTAYAEYEALRLMNFQDQQLAKLEHQEQEAETKRRLRQREEELKAEEESRSRVRAHNESRNRQRRLLENGGSLNLFGLSDPPPPPPCPPAPPAPQRKPSLVQRASTLMKSIMPRKRSVSPPPPPPPPTPQLDPPEEEEKKRQEFNEEITSAVNALAPLGSALIEVVAGAAASITAQSAIEESAEAVRRAAANEPEEPEPDEGDEGEDSAAPHEGDEGDEGDEWTPEQEAKFQELKAEADLLSSHAEMEHPSWVLPNNWAPQYCAHLGCYQTLPCDHAVFEVPTMRGVHKRDLGCIATCPCCVRMEFLTAYCPLMCIPGVFNIVVDCCTQVSEHVTILSLIKDHRRDIFGYVPNLRQEIRFLDYWALKLEGIIAWYTLRYADEDYVKLTCLQQRVRWLRESTDPAELTREWYHEYLFANTHEDYDWRVREHLFEAVDWDILYPLANRITNFDAISYGGTIHYYYRAYKRPEANPLIPAPAGN